MVKRFENKKLNKEDHEQVDKAAKDARKATEGISLLLAIGGVFKLVPLKKIGTVASKVVKMIFKV